MQKRRRVDVESVMRLAEMADYVIPFALRVVADLGVADELEAGPRPVEELAEATGCHAPSLLRTLRTLAGQGVFTEVSPGVFGLTPLAEPLLTDHPMSLRAAYPLLTAEVQAWSRFDWSVRTGTSAFELVHGREYWSYMSEHEELSVPFNRSQEGATRLELRTVLPAYPGWRDFEVIVDVGGGNGTFLAGILSRFRSLRGVLFDLEHAVAGAGEVLEAAGVADRCEVVAGSFFERVPEGADAYLLKRVLYNWEPEAAARLLRSVRTAMRDDSRLLLLEPLASAGDSPDVGQRYDLLMLTMTGGGARSLEENERLLDGAGLRVNRVLPTMMLPIVEAVPAGDA